MEGSHFFMINSIRGSRGFGKEEDAYTGRVRCEEQGGRIAR